MALLKSISLLITVLGCRIAFRPPLVNKVSIIHRYYFFQSYILRASSIDDPNKNGTQYYSSDELLLRGSSNIFTVKLPPGLDANLSEKDKQLIKRKESLQSDEKAGKDGKDGKSDLDILKEELRLLIEKMAES